MLKKIINTLFYSPYNTVKRSKNIAVHNTSILLRSTHFRFDCKVNSNKVLIDQHSMVGCDFIFESPKGSISIGKNTFINSGTKLISRNSIKIGSHVTIAWGCTIYDHNSHSYDWNERKRDIRQQIDDYNSGLSFTTHKNWNTVKDEPIEIKDKVWIGFDSVILKGVTIGEGAIVGARTVIRSDVDPWTVVIGNPAIVVKRINPS
ncbi:acyltransferase [Desulfoluna spongiiphila]|uniref:acyltransferase n=1 Tax=Desulfoluna spongiiphila TaxID=419481 RepID=UPI001253D373|nr:acyltransferase [Desulfoluna spongiiphila]VVS90860.1 hexapeptide repeat [Desulfoluna spongiiphila]